MICLGPRVPSIWSSNPLRVDILVLPCHHDLHSSLSFSTGCQEIPYRFCPSSEVSISKGDAIYLCHGGSEILRLEPLFPKGQPPPSFPSAMGQHRPRLNRQVASRNHSLIQKNHLNITDQVQPQILAERARIVQLTFRVFRSSSTNVPPSSSPLYPSSAAPGLDATSHTLSASVAADHAVSTTTDTPEARTSGSSRTKLVYYEKRPSFHHQRTTMFSGGVKLTCLTTV